MDLQLQPKIDWALQWAERRVRPDGTIDGTGNTRSGEGLARTAEVPTADRSAAYGAAFYWYKITGEEHWERLARRLYLGQQSGLKIIPTSTR